MYITNIFVFLDCFRQARMSKFHTDGPQPMSKPATLILRCDSANQYATAASVANKRSENNMHGYHLSVSQTNEAINLLSYIPFNLQC